MNGCIRMDLVIGKISSLVENSVTKLTKIQHKSVDFFVDLNVLIWVVF